MTKAILLSKLAYAALVRLYPLGFRAEFGDEMQAVFAAKVEDAVHSGVFCFVAICLRELRDFPVSLLREHWCNHRDKKGDKEMLTREQRSMVAGLWPVGWSVLLLVVNKNFVLTLFTDLLGWLIATCFVLAVLLNTLMLVYDSARSKSPETFFRQRLGRFGKDLLSAVLTILAFWSVSLGPAIVTLFRGIPSLLPLQLERALLTLMIILNSGLFTGSVFLAAKMRGLKAQVQG